MGNQGPAQPSLSHRTAICTKQERVDPLTHIGPSLEMNSKIIRNYIIQNNMGQTKMGGTGVGDTTTVFPED